MYKQTNGKKDKCMEWFPSCPPLLSPPPRCVNSSKQFCSRLIAIVSWLSHPMRNVIYWKLNKETIDLTRSRSKLINWSWHVSYFIFFFRKISWSACFGFRLALWAVLAAAWSVDGGFGVLFACMLPLDRSCGWYLLRCVVILVVQPEVLMVLLHVLQTATLSKIVPSCLRFLSPQWRQISALPFVFATTTKSSSLMTHCPLVVCKQQSRGMRYRV